MHAQIGVNWGPCGNNCGFCVLAESTGLAKTQTEFTKEEVVRLALRFEMEGADAISLMSTATYDFYSFLDIGRASRKALKSDIPVCASIGGLDVESARAVRGTGFSVIYHARRLREGVDTKIDPRTRISTIKAAKAASLGVSSCVEPIVSEHTEEEIVGEIFECKDLGVVVMATMKRIPVPGSLLHSRRMTIQAEFAKIAAVARLVMGNSIVGMGVHEPNVLSLMAGANAL